MTATAESTKFNESVLQSDEALGDLSKDCQIIGYRCDTGYELRQTNDGASGKVGAGHDFRLCIAVRYQLDIPAPHWSTEVIFTATSSIERCINKKIELFR